MQPDSSSQREERLSKAARHAHSLVTLLISWYAVPEGQRGSVLGEQHLLNLLEVVQQSTHQLVSETTHLGKEVAAKDHP